MLKFKVFLGILTLCLGAGAQSLDSKQPPKTKESMAEFLDLFAGLQKYLGSEEEFQNPKNAEDISRKLKGLVKAAGQTAHDKMLTQENFKFSRQVLEDHVVEIDRTFRLGNKPYALWMLNSTLGICMSCHTQLPTQSRKFSVLMNTALFPSDFDKAEFMFATKNFEGANKIYRSLIMTYPKNMVSADIVDRSAQRILSYDVRIRRDLDEAKKAIKGFQTNKELPAFVARNLGAWTEQLERWEKLKIPDAGRAKETAILDFVEKNLSISANRTRIEASEPRFISNLIVSGLLYEFLEKRPTSKKLPEALFWLAKVDREIARALFYSLSDLYLKECMLRFPESPTAMKCFKEFEAETIFGYSGSSGTHVPDEVLQELKRLKAYVESKGKVPLKRGAP